MEYRIIEKSEFDRIKSADLEGLKKTRLIAEMCRFNTLVAVKKAGSGHLGSSLSAADITAYLYLNELNVLEEGFDSPDRDIYFSSKGHDVPGLYSLFYALGVLPEEKLLALRRLGGVDGHPEVRIPGIESSTGSLGMGISKAKGMAWAKKYKGSSGNVFVLTGDGEFQEGQIWESLQAAAHQKIDNLIAIMDHNKYQTDMLVSDVNNIEDLVTKISSFGWHVQRINGHDFNALHNAVKTAKGIKGQPKFIIADTIKGKGVSFMERPEVEEASGKTYYKWHSGAPDDDNFVKGLEELKESIQSIAAEFGVDKIDIPEMTVEKRESFKLTKEFVTDAYGEALCELGKVNDKLVVLDGDLSADCKLRKFEKMFPYRFVENGIAEQDMASMAGGLAHMGMIPVVNTFGSFLAARANEQIYNNATEETKIIYTCHFAGLIPAGPGKSHQSVRDISLFSALPNVTIIQPCNGAETKLATEYCVNEAKENCMLRLIIGPSPETIELPEDYKFEFGKGTVLTDGSDAVMFAYGPVMLHEALLASKYLRDEGFGLKVINMPWLNKIDSDWLAGAVKNYNRIFVLEDHSIIGGLGDRILNSLAASGNIGSKEFKKIGIFDYPECGTPLEVLNYHGLDGESIAKSIINKSDIKTDENIKNKYTADAPQ